MAWFLDLCTLTLIYYYWFKSVAHNSFYDYLIMNRVSAAARNYNFEVIHFSFIRWFFFIDSYTSIRLCPVNNWLVYLIVGQFLSCMNISLHRMQNFAFGVILRITKSSNIYVHLKIFQCQSVMARNIYEKLACATTVVIECHKLVARTTFMIQ